MKLLFQRGWIAGLLLATFSLSAADTLIWRTKADRVTADIQSAGLIPVLEGVAKLTGWHVFLESNITQNVSVKFKDLPSGDALRFMLGDLNYAFVPQTNGSPRLFVFRTTRANATLAIQPGDLASGKKAEAKIIPNELIVRLKPGASIDELAKKLGAKVIGKIDGLNAYRLQFADEAAADAARALLANNSDVASVENNYVVDAPPPVGKLDMANAPTPVHLKLNPSGDNGRVIVGLIDTAVRPTGSEYDKFLAGYVSVAGDANFDPNSPSHGPAMFQYLLNGVASVSGDGSSIQVYSVDVYGKNVTSTTFEVAAGIAEAINKGHANIINYSGGGPDASQVLRDIIQQAVQNGIPVFAAAGNDASSKPFFPAAWPEVISVTAGNNGQRAAYANYADYIKLMLPGSAVVYFGNTAYVVSGTSASSALASGMAAGVADSKHISPTIAAGALLNTPTFQFKPSK